MPSSDIHFPFMEKVGDLGGKQIGARPGPTMSAWPGPGPGCLQKIIGMRHQQKKKLKHICDIFRRSV